MTNSAKKNQTEQLVWIYGTILFLLGTVLAIVNPSYFEQVYTLEDGLLEWLTVLALGTTTFVTLQRIALYHQFYQPTQKLILWITAAVFLFGTGEEISWGQRLFAIESNEFFQMHNAQGETNLHNLIIGSTKINKLVFGKMIALGFLIYLGVICPLYYRKQKALVTVINRFAIPIPRKAQWWGFLVVVLMVEGLIQLASDTPKRGELTEFGASLMVMLTVCFPHNKAVFDR